MAQEKIFANGFTFKRRENAPDFVIGRMSLKADDAIAFIKEHAKNGWLNLEIKAARSGNYYVELDMYDGKTSAAAPKSAPSPVPSVDDDMPF
jgi:hypothetical protein